MKKIEYTVDGGCTIENIKIIYDELKQNISKA